MLVVLFGIAMRLLYCLLAYSCVVAYRAVTIAGVSDIPRDWPRLIKCSRWRRVLRRVTRLLDSRAPAPSNYHPERPNASVDSEHADNEYYRVAMKSALVRHGGPIPDIVWPLATFFNPLLGRRQPVPRVYRTNSVINSLTFCIGIIVAFGSYGSTKERDWSPIALNIVTEAAATHWIAYLVSGFLTIVMQRIAGPRRLRFTRFCLAEAGAILFSNLGASALAYAPGNESPIILLVPLFLSVAVNICIMWWQWQHGEEYFGGAVLVSRQATELELMQTILKRKFSIESGVWISGPSGGNLADYQAEEDHDGSDQDMTQEELLDAGAPWSNDPSMEPPSRRQSSVSIIGPSTDFITYLERRESRKHAVKFQMGSARRVTELSDQGHTAPQIGSRVSEC